MPYSSFHRVANTYRRPLKACAAAPLKGRRGDKQLGCNLSNVVGITPEVMSFDITSSVVDTLTTVDRATTGLAEGLAQGLSQLPLPVMLSTGLTSPKGRNGAPHDYIIGYDRRMYRS